MESQTTATVSQSDGAAWLTIEQASRYLNLGRSTVYIALNSGQLSYAKVGRCRRIAKAELDRFMAAASVPARAASVPARAAN